MTAMNFYTDCLNWVAPDVPMAPTALVVNAIRDAVIDLCERGLVFKQELPQILVTPPISTTTTVGQNASICYLALPGVPGSYASTPAEPANQITSDIDIQAEIQPSSWASSQQNVIAKWSALGFSYRMYVTSAGKIGLDTSPDGTTILTGVSTVATGFSAGYQYWIRATLQVNNGSGSRVYNFYTAPDGVTWTLLGTTVTTSGATSISGNTSLVEIGSDSGGTANLLAGNIYDAVIYSGIGVNGTLALSFNPSDGGAGTTVWNSYLTNEVWSVFGNAAVNLSAVTPNTLTIASTNGFVNGITLTVQLVDGTKWRGHQVGPPSGNTITLDGNLNQNVDAGATVEILTYLYPVTPPAGMSVSKVLQAWFNNNPIDPISPDDLSNEFNNTDFAWVGQNWRTDVNLPTRFYMYDDLTVAVLMPNNGAAGLSTLRLNCALKPTRASTAFPSQIYERYIEAIAHGAKARIMAIPKKPYSDPQSAAYHGDKFIGWCGEAMIKSARGKTRAPLRTHSVYRLR